MQFQRLPWNFDESKPQCTDPVDWANSARDIAKEFRAAHQGEKMAKSTLRAAILVLSRVQAERYVFDLPFLLWCETTQSAFQRAIAGHFEEIDFAEAADWFELLSLFLEA